MKLIVDIFGNDNVAVDIFNSLQQEFSNMNEDYYVRNTIRILLSK